MIKIPSMQWVIINHILFDHGTWAHGACGRGSVGVKCFGSSESSVSRVEHLFVLRNPMMCLTMHHDVFEFLMAKIHCF